jgi:dihydrofolate reductase
MRELEPQTASGKVHLAFTMSVDGFVAGPGHSMDWMAGTTQRPGLVQEYMEATGAVLAGRDGYDSAIGDSRPYGGAWEGPIFVLTHHPEDARPAEDITFLSCSLQEAVRIGLEAAGGKNLQVFSADIGRQLLHLGLVDEIDIHIAPVLLGDGIRFYTAPGSAPVRLNLLNGDVRRLHAAGVPPLAGGHVRTDPRRRRPDPSTSASCAGCGPGR